MEKECSHWQKGPEYFCSVISEQPQTPLHKQEAEWMLNKLNNKGMKCIKWITSKKKN